MVQKEVEVTRGKVRSARRMVELVPGRCRAAFAEPREYKLRVSLNTNYSSYLTSGGIFNGHFLFETSTTKENNNNQRSQNGILVSSLTKAHWIITVYEHVSICDHIATLARSIWYFIACLQNTLYCNISIIKNREVIFWIHSQQQIWIQTYKILFTQISIHSKLPSLAQ